MNEKVNSLTSGTFEIDLIEIELSKGDTSITGKGVIYQKNEELHLKLFNDNPISEESKIEEFVTSINQSYKTKILKEDDYFILTGKDENENLFLSKIHAPYIASKIIEGKLSADLVKTKITQRNPLTNIIEIYINDSGPIPLNDSKSIRIFYRTSEIQSFKPFNDAWFLIVPDKYKIQVQRNDNYQKIRIETELQVSEEEIDKILDCLRFVFGRYFNWFYINFNSGIKEKYNLRKYSVFRNTIFFPPLKINNSYNVYNYEKLFNCYYAYLSNANEPEKNLNFHVRKTNIAGYSYLGAFELVLATSIEGVLKIFKTPNHDTMKKDGEMVDDVEKISKFLKENFNEENKVRKRVGGVLKRIHSNKISDAVDILNYLVDNKIIPPEYKEVYNLRNLFAHAVVPDNDTIERLIDLKQMTALFYHLVFLQIGYNGQYTNYFNDELEDFTQTIS